MAYPAYQRARAFKYVQRAVMTDIGITSTTWADLDNTFDMALEAQAGDVIEVGLSAIALAPAGANLLLDYVTLVAGNPVTSLGTGVAPTAGSEGVEAWHLIGTTQGIGGSIMRVLNAADIANGVVTLRWRGRVNSGTGTIYVNAGAALQAWAKNLGPMDPH